MYHKGEEYIIRTLGERDWFVRNRKLRVVLGKRVIVAEEPSHGRVILTSMDNDIEKVHLNEGKLVLLSDGLVMELIAHDTPELLAYDLIDQEQEVGQEDY